MLTLAWHFSGARLRDGRPIPPVGEWLEHDGPIFWCKSGLYASRRIIDALTYAPGNILHKVECQEIEYEDGEKFVCRRRRIVAFIDGEQLLRKFARQQALSVAHLWDMPPAVRQYLETGDEQLRAAARTAVGNAIRDAAWDAARDATCASIRAVAWDTATDTAWNATQAAATAAARDATWAITWAATEAVVRDVAWAAAWAIARDSADRMLTEMVEQAMQLQREGR